MSKMIKNEEKQEDSHVDQDGEALKLVSFLEKKIKEDDFLDVEKIGNDKLKRLTYMTDQMR